MESVMKIDQAISEVFELHHHVPDCIHVSTNDLGWTEYHQWIVDWFRANADGRKWAVRRTFARARFNMVFKGAHPIGDRAFRKLVEETRNVFKWPILPCERGYFWAGASEDEAKANQVYITKKIAGLARDRTAGFEAVAEQRRREGRPPMQIDLFTMEATI